MAQNIYDDPAFFAGYSQLARSRRGLAGAPEWSSVQALMPEMRGLRVLDLGCGFGWFCRWAREQGAASVLGLDVSERMLARARAMTEDAAIIYERADLEHAALPEAAFDAAFSALTLHYIEDLGALLARLHRALRPGAAFVATMEHPIYTASRAPGWIADAEGRKRWPVDSYQMEGARVTDWIAKGVVKQHRTMGTTLNAFMRAGFALSHVEEWGPSEAQLAAQPELAEERERPMFLIIAARKAADASG